VEQSEICFQSATPLALNSISQIGIGFDAIIQFSDDPSSPFILPNPKKRIPILRGPVGVHLPLRPGMYGSDETPLEKTVDGLGNITQLSAQAKNGTTYTLTFSVSTNQVAKVGGGQSVLSATAKLEATGRTPLYLSISYALWDGSLYFVLSQIPTNAAATRAIGMQILISTQVSADSTVGVARGIQSFGYTYSTQKSTINDLATTSPLLMPVDGVFWAFLDQIYFFYPALALLRDTSLGGGGLPDYSGDPLQGITNMTFSVKPNNNIEDQVSGVLAPSIAAIGSMVMAAGDG